ncbi:hypothetical protein XENOCAPTIV_030774 [Xenoophorus captivus]|uniref:Uncharacterized protein n=1 Tax=Xenoophorus captivus TaxID=1517983 RepID=A0ABV0QXG1_9TELE
MCVCALKTKEGCVKSWNVLWSTVFTYSSSSHALPQTGSTPPPLLFVKSPATPLHQCVCVCVCISSEPATSPVSVRHLGISQQTLVYTTLACPGVCVCVGVMHVFRLLTAECGAARPSKWLPHTLTVSSHYLSCLSTCPTWDGWKEEVPLCHRQG